MTELARIYGGSLYELASEEDLGGELLKELSRCGEIFGENPDYLKLLSAPSIPKEERRGIVDRAFTGRVHTYVVSFLKLLVDRDAASEFSGCVDAFRQRYYEDNGILEVTATTAVELRDGTKKKLTDTLTSVFGKEILLKCVVDPGVLGGMRLECAGKRYDGTVRDRLMRIEKGLRETVL